MQLPNFSLETEKSSILVAFVVNVVLGVKLNQLTLATLPCLGLVETFKLNQLTLDTLPCLGLVETFKLNQLTLATLLCLGLVETFARTLAEHGIRATRLPHELDIESATSNTFFHMVSRDAELAKPVLRATNVWYVGETVSSSLTSSSSEQNRTMECASQRPVRGLV